MIWWLRKRKLDKLKMRLPGRKAALRALAESGYTNYGISEDIAVLEYKIERLKEKMGL